MSRSANAIGATIGGTRRFVLSALLLAGSALAACSGSQIQNPAEEGAGGSLGTGASSGSGGVCRGLTLCGDACVDTDIDPENCGGCGEACPEGQVCNGAGECSLECYGGTTRCGDVCVDTEVDHQNCGQCGVTCQPGEICDGTGQCALACVEGLVGCGGACVDPLTDDGYCGAKGDCAGDDAGEVCSGAYACIDGSCELTCEPNEIACGDGCVDPLSDAAYCGASGDCVGANAGTNCNGGYCDSGTCVPQGCIDLVGTTNVSGTYSIDPDGPGGDPPFQVFCDMATDGGGWTLVARFSNADTKNWMIDNGDWWYDRTTEAGSPLSRSANADAISKAFWTVKGDVLKISRTNNPDDAFLLQTNAGCLGNKTFREFITGFGNFRSGTWRINGNGDGAHGHCPGTLGNNFSTTMGFAQAQCNTGDYGSIGGLSFWSAFSRGDGAVIQIGPGGASCDRADHGIGTTEANDPGFVFSTESDFGNESGDANPGYALNLFVK